MRILLTGASRGIGRAIAERLAKPGVSIAVCASSSSKEHDDVVAACRQRGAQVEGLTGDLSDGAAPAALVARAVSAFAGLDAVVSNAGVVAPSTLVDLQEDAWDRIFSINVRGPWLLARAAHSHLTASKGTFVSVASMSGVEPYPGTGAYSPSKAALIMLVRTLALEWAASGVRVNSVSPGLFHSAMTAPIYADLEKKAAREAIVPLRRIGDPTRDLAGVIEFLLSSDAGYVTGQNILVDGGLLGSIQSNIVGRPKSGGN